MQKTIKFGVLLLFLLFTVGCGQNQEKSDVSVEDNQQQASSEKQNQVMSAVDDIQKAIKNGEEMECTYNDTQSNTNATVSIKSNKYRSVASFEDKKFYSLSDGETIYTWTEGEKTGMMMKISCLEEMGDQIPSAEEDQEMDYRTDPSEFASDYQGNIKCQKTSGTDFEIPNDVDFKDFCQGLKDTMEQIKNLPNMENLPNMPKIPANLQ